MRHYVADALVTQIPALIVSTSVGLLVSKAGILGSADKALLKQLSGYPKALGMSGAVMVVMALLPGIPMLPFLALGGGAGALAYVIDKRTKVAAAKEAGNADAAAKSEAKDDPISASLKMDDLKVELGYALLPLVNSPDGTDRLTEQIKALRHSLAAEMGFVMPAVRILDNVQLDANGYVIKIKEVEAGSGKVWTGQYMVMDPGGGQVKLPRHPHHRADLRPAGHLGRRRGQGRGHAQGLHRGGRRHRAVHAFDRTAEEQHGGAAVLWRGAEAA
jgi:flagellar biosynthesis protein FlhA